MSEFEVSVQDKKDMDRKAVHNSGRGSYLTDTSGSICFYVILCMCVCVFFISFYMDSCPE